jgi:hypothetical protein
MGLLLLIQLQHLALLAPVDAPRRPALLPVRQPHVLFVEGFEPAPLQGRALGVLDRALHRALAVGVADPARIGHHAVMREQRGIDRVQPRFVQIGAEHALF